MAKNDKNANKETKGKKKLTIQEKQEKKKAKKEAKGK